MRFIVLGCLMLSTGFCFSQEILSTKSKKAIELYLEADNFRVRGQFAQAIDLLKEAIEKDKKFEEAYYRLGLTYKNASNLPQCIETLQKGLPLTTTLVRQKPYYFLLGEIYLRQGQYENAKTYLEKYLNVEKADRLRVEQATLWKTHTDFSLAHQNEKYQYEVKPLSDSVNAYPMQYFPTLTADDSELIFTVRFGKAHDDNEDIFVSRKGKNDQWLPPVSLSDRINSTYREGACTISADGRKFIFTICGPKGCDLYESIKTGSEWSAPQSLGSAVNTTGWEAQPSLSADGNELYFVSDRRGGVGGYDIWYSKKDSTGKWMRAVNLGKSVNTKFDEIAPYVHVNNKNLYYASNGLPGFGGYDIYVSEKEGMAWGKPMNMGAPLNDFNDQYSFAVSSDGATAYFSKEEGRNSSKIYSTLIPDQFRIKYKSNVVSGMVRDKNTKRALNATIELFDLRSSQKISVFESDSITGDYLIVLPGKSEYALHAASPGYLFSSLNFNYENYEQTKPLIIDLELQPIEQNSITVLNNIFFPLNEYQLTDKSLLELEEVVTFLRKNPSIKVEIGGHTDNQGKEEYNKQLSLRRAQSVVDFLKLKGISPSRLFQRGYGSQKPLKPNDSEQNRQLNRRIEFKILG